MDGGRLVFQFYSWIFFSRNLSFREEIISVLNFFKSSYLEFSLITKSDEFFFGLNDVVTNKVHTFWVFLPITWWPNKVHTFWSHSSSMTRYYYTGGVQLSSNFIKDLFGQWDMISGSEVFLHTLRLELFCENNNGGQ